MSSEEFDPKRVAANGPFEVDVKVHITNGNSTGVVTVGLAAGEYPTAERIRAAVAEAEQAAKSADMRLMDRHEFVRELLGDGPVAVPGPNTFQP